jgi:hypothetical protein
MDDRIVCMISGINGGWTWQYEGVPPTPKVKSKK